MEASSDVLTIDGSEEEGGGQMFRMSIALSQILSKPVEVFNIRANRKPPGLKDQHLTGLLAMIELTQAEAEGAKMKSSTVKYNSNGTIVNPVVKAECTGAGSMNLILQMALPAILFAKNEPSEEEVFTVSMKGGSIGSWAPSYLSIHYALKPLLSQFGIDFDYNVIKHGFFPDLRGAWDLVAKPAQLPIKAIDFTTRGNITKVELITVYCNDLMKQWYETSIADSLASKLQEEIKDKDNVASKDIEVSVESYPLPNPRKKACTLCCVWVLTLENGAKLYQDILIEGSKRMKAYKREEATEIPYAKEINKFYDKIVGLINHNELCIDEHHADQLLIFMALAEGTSKIRTVKPLSGHITGMIHILQKFIPELNIEITEHDNSTEIIVEGIGFKR